MIDFVMWTAHNSGKKPVEVRGVSEFAANHIPIPMINEAVSIYAERTSNEDTSTEKKLGGNHIIETTDPWSCCVLMCSLRL